MKPTPEDKEKLSAPAQEWLESGTHIEIEKRSIFVTDRGEGIPILLIHGHPSSCLDWKGVCDRLESQARLVAFDMVGWGLSDKPASFSYSLMQQADVVDALMKTLGIKEAHVVSHDLGTSLHTELLARDLERELSFKVLSSQFFNGSILQWLSNEPGTMNRAQSNKTLFQAMEEFVQVTPEAFVEGFKMATLGNLSVEDMQLRSELFFYKDQHLRLAAQSGYMRERYVHRDRWVGAMQKSNPVRIAWAKDDPVAVVAIGRELEKQCPNATYVEWGGIGHFPNAEDPDFVAEQVALSAGLSYSANK